MNTTTTTFRRGSDAQLNKQPAAAAGMLVLLCLTALTGMAQTYSVLKNLSGHPVAGLTLSGSTLYGTDPGPNYGGLFKINTDGTGYTGLKGFGENDGPPLAGLVLSGSTLYGATAGAQNPNGVYRYRYGVVFKVDTNGSGYTELRKFSGRDGAYPKARLVLSGETLYGTTSYGPVSTNGGTVYFGQGTLFRINTDGSGFTNLMAFGGYNGYYPVGGLALSGGTLYGTTSAGGYGGTIFKINTDGTGYTVLRYGMSGLSGDLVLSGTTLYGTSSYEGVFKINTDGTGYTVLKGVNAQAGLFLSDQTLYGTAASGGLSNVGTVFRISTDGSHFGVLKHFTGSDGSMPVAPVVFSGDTLCGTLYGTTKNGGTLGAGVVFSLSLAPPSILTPPASQAVGTGTTAEFSVAAGGSDPLEYR